MKQSLHVLIIERERGEALVMRFGGRWLLPILSVPEHVRAGPLVLKWVGQRGVAGEFVGQWLGRAAPRLDAVDWLAMVRARTREPLLSTPALQWISIDGLSSTAACLEYQQWAVARTTATAEFPTVPGAFGSLTWMDELKEWLATVFHSRAPEAWGDVVPHRATACEVVLEIRTARQRYFLKGLSSDRAREATITIELSEIAPDSFPRTYALGRRADGSVWWLMEACAGSTLAASRALEAVTRVAAAKARTQQRIATCLAHGRQLALPAVELSHLGSWGTDLLSEETDASGCASEWIQEQCARVARSPFPNSWVAADLDPGNVVVDGNDVRFIDLDGSVLAPAPIAAAVLARRLERHGIGGAEAVYAAYEQGWAPPLDVRGCWREIEVVSHLLETYLAWERVVVKTNHGEIFDLLDPARAVSARRLADRLRIGSAANRHRG